MKEFNLPTTVHWEEYDLDVSPYLTMEECKRIADLVIIYNTPIEREECLLSSVLLCVTPLFDEDNKDTVYTYEELRYSGFWDSLLKEFPYIQKGIDLIQAQIAEKESLLNTIVDGVGAVIDGFTEALNEAQESNENINLSQLMNMFKSWKDGQESSDE